MRAKKTFLFFALAILFLSPLTTCHAKDNPSLIFLKQCVDQVNKSCPMTVDYATTLEKVFIKGKHVIYQYSYDESILGAFQESGPNNKETIKATLISNAQNDNAMQYACLVQRCGMTLIHRYKGAKSKKTTDIEITPAEYGVFIDQKTGEYTYKLSPKSLMTLEEIRNTFKSEEKMYPIQIRPNISMTSASVEGNDITYTYVYDEAIFESILSDPDQVRLQMKSFLLSMASEKTDYASRLIRSAINLGMNFVFLCHGTKSEEVVSIKITPADF